MSVVSRLTSLIQSFRSDGYENTLSGLGVGGRTQANRFVPADTLTEEQLLQLHDNNWLARRIVETLPAQALRKPILADPKGIAEFTRLNTDARFPNGIFKQALNMGRLCGGAMIVIGVKGSGTPLEQELPIDPATGAPRAGKIEFLDLLTRFQVESDQKYDTPEDPTTHGRTSVFKVKSGRLKGLKIHASRMIFFEGDVKTRLEDGKQEDRDFPWQSCLQNVAEALSNYGISWTAVSHLLQEASIAYLKLKGLTDLLGTENRSLVEERMNLFSVGRTVAKTVFLDGGNGNGDTGEEFGRVGVSFQDVPQLLEQLTLTISGASAIPVSILLGQPPSGLNATGEMDLRQFYDRVEEYRTNSVKPKLDMLLIVTGSKPEYSFPSLWDPTASQLADIRVKNTGADAQLFTIGVVEPDDILRSRAKDGTLGIKFDDVDALLAEKAKQKNGPKIEITPTENARAITINEIRANQGKDPLTLPGGGGLDPDADLPSELYYLKKTAEIDAIARASNPAATTTSGTPGTPSGEPSPADGGSRGPGQLAQASGGGAQPSG